MHILSRIIRSRVTSEILGQKICWSPKWTSIDHLFLKILINVHVRFIIFKRLKWLQMILNYLKLPFLSGIFFFKVGNCICTFVWDFRVLIEIMGNLYFIWLIYFFFKESFLSFKCPKVSGILRAFFQWNELCATFPSISLNS